MQIKAVLFDLDESLLDRSGSLATFIQWQAQDLFKFSKREHKRFCARFVELDDSGRVWKDLVYAQLVDEFNLGSKITEQLLEQYVTRFSEFCRCREGVETAISQLHERGFQLGLVSNGPSPFQEQNFKALGLTDYLDAMVVSGAVGCRKPDREIFDLACNTLQVRPQECVFVGDNPVADIAGSKACGMYSIYIPGLHGKVCELADATCAHFRQLPALIQQACI